MDAEVHAEHFKVIRSDILPISIERTRDVENELISEKIQRVSQGTIFQTLQEFSKRINSIFKV